jgi:hypothetical protein
MERPSIYVYFGSDKICLCCILVLFKKFTDEDSYKNFMMSCIHELKEKAGCDPDDDDFDILFDYRKANAVRIMFGAHFVLRSNAIKNLVNWMYHVDTRLGAVCQYLCNMFSWYEMEHFNLLNDMLVNPQSPVLLDPCILREVDNLTDACSAVMDCEYPQFYSLMVTNADSLKVEPSNFPTLIAVAKVLASGGDDNSATVEEISFAYSANPITVNSLVKVHLKAIPQI